MCKLFPLASVLYLTLTLFLVYIYTNFDCHFWACKQAIVLNHVCNFENGQIWSHRILWRKFTISCVLTEGSTRDMLSSELLTRGLYWARVMLFAKKHTSVWYGRDMRHMFFISCLLTEGSRADMIWTKLLTRGLCVAYHSSRKFASSCLWSRSHHDMCTRHIELKFWIEFDNLSKNWHKFIPNWDTVQIDFGNIFIPNGFLGLLAFARKAEEGLTEKVPCV